MKKYIFAVLMILFLMPITTLAKEIPVYIFWDAGCPFCLNQKEFMVELEDKYPEINILEFEIFKTEEGLEIMKEASEILGVNISGVPFTIIGDDYVSGFGRPDTTGREIERMIEYCLENDCPDILAHMVSTETGDQSDIIVGGSEGEEEVSVEKNQLARADSSTNWPVMIIMLALPLFLVIFLISLNKEKKS